MSDEQLKRRLVIRRILFVSALLFLASIGLIYYTYSTETEWQTYLSEKSQESSYQSQIATLTASNNNLIATIEENGKQLVSFSEDKIKYINLASDLSLTYNVRINKLAVSDVWDEGEMSGMTTAIEVEGGMSNIRGFIDEYCGTRYTNRVNVISCRPTGRYAWLTRSIDGNKVIGWFDTSADEQMYERQMQQIKAEERALLQQQGIITEEKDPIPLQIVPVYDPETGTIVDLKTGVALTQEQIDEIPITIDTMFSDKPMKVYLVIDFLGRK